MKTQTTSRAAMRNAVTGVLSFVLLAGCTMGDKPAPSQVSAADAKQMMAKGQTNGGIAESLCLSEYTVRNHLTNVYAKLGLEGARDAVAWAWRTGVVRP